MFTKFHIKWVFYIVIHLTKDSDEDLIKLNKPFNLHLYHLVFYYLKQTVKLVYFVVA